jgi:hypothetical protein
MKWEEVVKNKTLQAYEEQLVEEYQGMITEVIQDLQKIQKLDNSSAITKRIVALIRGSNDMYGGDTLAEAFGYVYEV